MVGREAVLRRRGDAHGNVNERPADTRPIDGDALLPRDGRGELRRGRSRPRLEPRRRYLATLNTTTAGKWNSRHPRRQARKNVETSIAPGPVSPAHEATFPSDSYVPDSPKATAGVTHAVTIVWG